MPADSTDKAHFVDALLSIAAFVCHPGNYATEPAFPACELREHRLFGCGRQQARERRGARPQAESAWRVNAFSAPPNSIAWRLAESQARSRYRQRDATGWTTTTNRAPGGMTRHLVHGLEVVAVSAAAILSGAFL